MNNCTSFQRFAKIIQTTTCNNSLNIFNFTTFSRTTNFIIQIQEFTISLIVSCHNDLSIKSFIVVTKLIKVFEYANKICNYFESLYKFDSELESSFTYIIVIVVSSSTRYLTRDKILSTAFFAANILCAFNSIGRLLIKVL